MKNLISLDNKIQPVPMESGKPEKVHYTSVYGSWLNIAEIELSAMSKQCTKRRIPNMGTLKKELIAWIKERNIKKVGVN